MRRADSEDYLLHDEEEQRELRAFGFGGLGSSSDSEDEQRPKRRRLESTDAIGLDLVMGQALHPLAPGVAGAPAAAAAIDASEEAEASLLQLEVEGLLREARPDGGAEAALLRQLQHLATLLRGLPQAEVAAGGLIRGFLADLGFRPVVSAVDAGRRECCVHAKHEGLVHYHIASSTAVLRAAGHPLPPPPPPQRPFTFRPPARVQVVGSFALCASVLGAQPPCVDLALLMPPACFDSKDQLNHR